MKILFIALPGSIHTARWISQLVESEHEIFLFPSVQGVSIHSSLLTKKVKSFIPWWTIRTQQKGFFSYSTKILKKVTAIFLRIIGNASEQKRLANVINKINPDIIHTLETQHAGYLVIIVKKIYFENKKFPLWLHTNWGSDIYLFGRLSEHKNRVECVIKQCDYYSCESERDIILAKKFGLKGYSFAPFPNTGGFNLEDISKLSSIITSERKVILIKGYQGWAGRALFALRALEIAKESLTGFNIEIFSNPDGNDIRIASELFTQNTGIVIKILPYISDHFEMLTHYARSRIYVGLSISDAISTSLLEAMATGVFPIQSDTSTANEWIEDGITGFIVPAEDPSFLAKKIQIALNDDILVNQAAILNFITIKNRVELKLLKEKTLAIYNKIEEDIGKEIINVQD